MPSLRTRFDYQAIAVEKAAAAVAAAAEQIQVAAEALAEAASGQPAVAPDDDSGVPPT